MGPRTEAHGRPWEARGWRARDQARPALLLLLAATLPACGDRLSDIDPRPGFANLFGAHLEGRLPPPGLDQPWPRLSTVPERPVPPDAATRAAISAALATDRDRSRAPLDPVIARPGGGAPVAPPAGAAPPAPPSLAAAPGIRLGPQPAAEPARATARPAAPPAAGPAAMPVPAAPLPAAPMPAAPPPAPGRDLLAPAAPGPALLAPPPPPGADLLAPRGG